MRIPRPLSQPARMHAPMRSRVSSNWPMPWRLWRPWAIFPAMFAGGRPGQRDAALLALRCQVLEEEEAGFPGNHYILISVAINIYNGDLHPSASARAVIQNMALPLQSATHHDSFVPIDSQRLIGARVVVVRIVAFARDEFEFPIPVQVCQSQRVGLRPAIVYQVFDPHTIPAIILFLLIPEDAVIVCQAGDQVRQTIAIHVFSVYEASGPQLELGVKDPLIVPGIGRSFKPTLGRNNVHTPISIDIASTDAVSVTSRADDMPNPRVARTPPCQFVPSQGKVTVAKLRQKLERLTSVQDIHQKGELYGGARLHEVFLPGSAGSARILPPSQRLRPV